MTARSNLPFTLFALPLLAASVVPLHAQTGSNKTTLAAPATADAPSPVAGTKKARVAKTRTGEAAKTAQARKTVAKAAPKAPEPWMAVDPARATNPTPSGAPPEPKSVVSHLPSADAVELGGKWSGSNDTAEKTRAENYNNDAAGTGGEVGLKLHF